MARHKGDRDSLVTRMPRAVGEAARSEAERRGATISDFVAALIAREVGLPELAPMPEPIKPRRQESLPLTG